MKKGIVMDMDDAFLTLLTPDGEFLRARRQEHSYAIGEEIQFSPVAIHNPVIWKLSKKDILKHKPIWAVSVAAAFLIFLGSLLPMYQDNKAYAYMSIDGSSSIELGINKKIEVVELTGYNKEGKNVISHISNWKNKDAFQIAKTILVEMQKEGQFNKNNHVIISTVITSQQEASADKKLKENLDEIKQTAEKDLLKINLIKGTENDREKARKEGLTIGKYEEGKMNSSINQPNPENQNANQPTRKEDTQKHDDQEQINNNTSSEPAIPPGQLKKEQETVPNIPAPAQNKGEIKGYTPPAETKKMPPGLEKKKQKNQSKVNFGQFKKQEYFKQWGTIGDIPEEGKNQYKHGNEGKGHKN